MVTLANANNDYKTAWWFRILAPRASLDPRMKRRKEPSIPFRLARAYRDDTALDQWHRAGRHCTVPLACNNICTNTSIIH